ncbi:WD-40 repeat protein [Reticulomyxa filosa]|uniref:WD-40 repeat protein n=1 Tax=Reticulomyxa filosa TaxID=46433 RepID=X6P7D1_RETFI|nr:WD-40 repeat protein [Reticulomyxa filosa]|eukprot:ETO34415.1 WD-40 repeat protein [Reticulomyxa filosa]
MAFNTSDVGNRDHVSATETQNEVFIKFEEIRYTFTKGDEKKLRDIPQGCVKMVGGMDKRIGSEKYEMEMKALIRLYGDMVKEEELKKKLEESNGNVSIVIEQMTATLMRQDSNTQDLIAQQSEHKDVNAEAEQRAEKLKKEDEKVEIGTTKPGINLQGYCTNIDCLAAKAKLPVWVNLGFGAISFHADNTLYYCPDCGQSTVASIIKTMIFNAEHSISASNDPTPATDNHYQCFYQIKSGLSYELKAKKIKQHATSLEDLITRSEAAMTSVEIINLVAELQKYLITVVKPPKVKDKVRLLEKIQCDYNGDYNQVFDVGRFTILCDNSTKLQTAVAVMKKAEKFNLIVSEDKDFFEKQSKTHHRFHNIKLYVPKHDVYVEMQATLKSFTTLEGYTVIENPKLSHLFYEHIRAWQPNDSEIEEEFKQASDETLTKINDIICEWVDDKGIQKIANRYKPHLDIGILKPPQLSKKSEAEINDNVPLKMAHFVYEQLCKFAPEKKKGKAIYVTLYEYYKKYVIGDKYPASCADFALLLQEARKQEMEEDIAIAQALETYIPLQANNYPHIDTNDNEKQETFDCYQYVTEFLKTEEKEEKKEHIEQQQQQHNQKKSIMIIQGKSGSGKSIFCRHLEQALWNSYISNSKNPIPVYISLPRVYNKNNERDIILQSLQSKNINKEILDVISEKVPFIFIMDGFDEIFDFYRKNENDKYFYDRFNLKQWNAKVIVTCRSNVLHEDEITTSLIGVNQNDTWMMYLWPFTKQQMYSYIEKFAKMKAKNKKKGDDADDWTPQTYEETLNNYPNLQKMVEEPFLLQLILSVLPSLVKQYGAGSRISKAQVYEVFNEQWIDIHSQNIISKLAELRIQMNVNKIKATLRQYCFDLGFDMFYQGNQVAIERDFQYQNDNEILNKLDSIMENEDKSNTADEKTEIKAADEMSGIADVWEKYFNGDSIAKYVLRRVGDNKYQFLHKSCQEYYAAQKIIFDIISWKPKSVVGSVNMDNQQFQQQFEANVSKLFINRKLLNEELGLIQFIADRIYDTNPIFKNLKSRLFRIIESSKNNENVSIAAANTATILNVANINMNNKNWNNVKIPHAILDRAFLEGTDLSNANLDHVSFIRTCLNNVNFTNTSMNEIYFGEYAYLHGHSHIVKGAQFSPDGSKIMSYAWDKTIRIWDASSGKQLQLLQGHSGDIVRVQFSTDGSKVISASSDKTIRIWDVLSGKQIQIWENHPIFSGNARFSVDGSKFASCGEDDILHIWDISSSNRIQSITCLPKLILMEFSSDGSTILSCSEDNIIRVWDVSSGKQLQMFEGHSEFVSEARFLLNGSKVISYSTDKTIRIWDVLSGKQVQVLQGHSAPIKSVELSPDGSKFVSCAEDCTIRIWDASSGNQIQLLQGHSSDVVIARFSPDCSKIVSGGQDNTIRIWDVSSGKQLHILEGHSQTVSGIEFFPKDPKILSWSHDGTIRVWDITLERKNQSIEGHQDIATNVHFSSDGSKVMSCSLDKTVQVWDVQTGRQLQVVEGHLPGIREVHFSPDGSKVVSFVDDNTPRIFDITTRREHLLEHSLYINLVQFSQDGTKIASSTYNANIYIWDTSSGKQVHLLQGHTSWIMHLQFSPDNCKLVSCSGDNTARLWDVVSGKQLQLFEGHSEGVHRVKFSPDGSKIVSCSTDNTIRLWDVSSGKQLLLLEGHSDAVKEVYFSPDGSKIVSCSMDRTARLWDALSGKQIQTLEDGENISALQFSSDGSKIISIMENTIRMWDASSGRRIQILEGHFSTVCDVKFSPDSKTIVSCSQDRTVRLWGSVDNKINVAEPDEFKCIWQAGAQICGLSMKNSIWKDTNGLTTQQKLLVEQRGGKF